MSYLGSVHCRLRRIAFAWQHGQLALRYRREGVEMATRWLEQLSQGLEVRADAVPRLEVI